LTPATLLVRAFIILFAVVVLETSMVDDTGGMSNMIGSLYEAALDPTLWNGLAPRLAQVFGASSAVIKTHRSCGTLDLLEATANLAQGPKDASLVDHWHRNDLWVQRSASFGIGRVVIGHELTPFSELEETGYYRDWLRLLSIHDMVGGVVDLGGGLGVLGVHRDRGEKPFDDRDRTRAAMLLPHLERALKIRDRLSDVGRMASITALEQSGTAVLVLAGDRRIVFLNAAAETLIATTPELSILGGRLHTIDSANDLRLGAAISRVLTATQGQLAPPPPIVLQRKDRGPLSLTLSAMPGCIGVYQEPAVLVLLRDPESGKLATPLLREAFGLTPAEAAVALHLCRGSTVAKIAGDLHVGLSTVRTHLKNVMLKTNTRRQAELVALLLGGHT
jgi:DNA-binding CsgD family transcriptional regulator